MDLNQSQPPATSAPRLAKVCDALLVDRFTCFCRETKEPGRRRRVLSEKAKRARSDAETVPKSVEGPPLESDEQEKKKRRRRSLEQVTPNLVLL